MLAVRAVAALFVGVVGFAAPLLAQAPGMNADLDPVQLFTRFCATSESRLPVGRAHPVAFRSLGEAAKTAVAFGAPRFPGSNVSLLDPLSPREAPNPLYEIGTGGRRFLMLPAARGPGAMATSCSVLWRGRDFVQARDALADIARIAISDRDDSVVRGAHSIVLRGRDIELQAVELDGWTMLRGTARSGD